MTFKTRIEAKDLLRDFKVISFKEEEMDAKTAMGSMKHWHIFHFIVQKKFKCGHFLTHFLYTFQDPR